VDKTVYYRHVTSPLGKLLLTSDGRALTAVHMLRLDEDSVPSTSSLWQKDHGQLDGPAAQLEAYFEGDRVNFDLTMKPAGTPFQQRVWQELCRIPYGTAISYAELARRIGQTGASRAVGGANGRNPIAIIVPCHRVISSDGALGGYGGGLDRKRWLLEHEAEVLARHPEWRTNPKAGELTPRLALV
jgi:methylated-DNA-[protein]-cysteine S-methyltransferase